jgi:Tol biopolymer transport system component
VYLVDGVRAVVPQLGSGHSPAWSHDGRWLGFVRNNEVWIVDPTMPLRGQPLDVPGNRFAWSPVADVIVTRSPGGLWIDKLSTLFGGGGDSFELVATPGIRDFAWAPDGRSVAYVVAGLPHDHLFTVAATGGTPQEVDLGPIDDDGITLAGWSPDGGQLLYWVEPHHSPDLAVDGTPLLRVPLTGGPVNVLRTLVVSSWLAPSPDGRRLLVVGGAGRSSWLNKQIFLCGFTTASCQDLATSGSSVSFDPSWSPNGDRIAFIQAPALIEPIGWDAKHSLWVSAPDGSRARRVRGTEGAMLPQWSRDGRHVLVVRNGGLWLVDVDAESMTGIAGPISDAVGDRLPRTYGRYDWGAYFAWSR